MPPASAPLYRIPLSAAIQAPPVLGEKARIKISVGDCTSAIATGAI